MQQLTFWPCPILSIGWGRFVYRRMRATARATACIYRTYQAASASSTAARAAGRVRVERFMVCLLSRLCNPG